MSRNWTKIAESLGLTPPESTAALDSLENIFRPLASSIPFETEPAYVLQVNDVDPAP